MTPRSGAGRDPRKVAPVDPLERHSPAPRLYSYSTGVDRALSTGQALVTIRPYKVLYLIPSSSAQAPKHCVFPL